MLLAGLGEAARRLEQATVASDGGETQVGIEDVRRTADVAERDEPVTVEFEVHWRQIELVLVEREGRLLVSFLQLAVLLLLNRRSGSCLNFRILQ